MSRGFSEPGDRVTLKLAMLPKLLLLFTIVPLVELALLIKLGQVMGLWTTIALVLTTGVAGAALARYEGLRTFWKMREELAAGRLPADPLIDALLILVAGALLVTPGLLTDGVGCLLLIPPTRALIRRWLKNRLRARFVMMDFRNVPGIHPPPDDGFVDVEARPEDPDQPRE